jgi:hypothetical protein
MDIMARKPADMPEILWCGSHYSRGKSGWSFPKAVKDTILKECDGMTILHLFGGRADFGLTMDIDPATRPAVIGDAWLPPFKRDSFDCVILDPPYVGDFSRLSGDKLRNLFAAAAWVARTRVIWFHPVWIESPARCVREKSWLVRVGKNCWVRSLQFYKVPSPERKLQPTKKFKRGPAIKYNRWLAQPNGFAFKD